MSCRDCVFIWKQGDFVRRSCDKYLASEVPMSFQNRLEGHQECLDLTNVAQLTVKSMNKHLTHLLLKYFLSSSHYSTKSESGEFKSLL